MEFEKELLTNKNRILLLINLPLFNLNNKNSAVANYLKTLSETLSKQNYIVDFYPAQDNTSPYLQKTTGTTFNNLISFLKSTIKKISPYSYNSIVLASYLKKQRIAAEHISDKKYELIIEFYTIGSDMGLKLKERTKSKLLLIYDCPVSSQYYEMYGSKTIFDRKIEKAERETIEMADCILCYSESVKNYIQKKYRTKNNFFEMPCIVWKGNKNVVKNKKGEEIIIGFIGSFLNWHKVSLLIEAFNKVAPVYPNLQLYLIGYGEEWRKIREMVDNNLYKERIFMPGFVSEEELEVIKSKMSIGVMPGSNWYGSPLKLFEYAEAGISIIAPTTPVVLDLFQGKNAVLFINPHQELNSLVENIELLLNDNSMKESLAQNVRKLMETEYSKENQMNNFIKLVQNLLKNGVEK